MKKLILPLLLFLFIMTEFTYGQDWANFARFKDDNAKIGLPAPDENRVVFMGNSITEGWSNHRPEFFEGKPYINRGISGQTTPQMLVRFRADVVDLKPKVVVILAGTNDIAGNTGPSTQKMIEDNIYSMAEIARANKIKVVICAVLPAFDYPWKPGLHPNEKIPALNAALKTYADKNGFVYLDYFAALTDGNNGMKEIHASDGVHPTKLGYSIMEPMVEAAIAEAMAQKKKKRRRK